VIRSELPVAMEKAQQAVIVAVLARKPASEVTAGRASIPAPTVVPATKSAEPRMVPGSCRKVLGLRLEKRRMSVAAAAGVGVGVVLPSLRSLGVEWNCNLRRLPVRCGRDKFKHRWRAIGNWTDPADLVSGTPLSLCMGDPRPDQKCICWNV
jgi:hypothetical protein